MVTLRVYDSASLKKEYATYNDRYVLYVPTPRNKVKEWGIMGMYLGFSFTDKQIIRCCWEECNDGVKSMNFGRKVKRESLPNHVRTWVESMEKVYNNALEKDTNEAWDEWNRS